MPLPAFVLPLMLGMSAGGAAGASGGKKGGGGDATAAMSQESFDMSKPAMRRFTNRAASRRRDLRSLS